MKNPQMMPIQPYLILRTDDYRTLRERKDGISHFYEFTMEKRPENGMQAVPDGSVDLLFGIGTQDVRTYIGGTVLAAKGWEFEDGRRYFGVRFQPGSCILPKELSIEDLVNRDLEIDGNLFGKNLTEQLAEAETIAGKAEIFLGEYRQMSGNRAPEGAEAIERYVREQIYLSQGNISMTQLAEETGYSECYIRRIFKQIHGISPKNFERFVRFQNMLRTMNAAKGTIRLDELAQKCGYYDESHMMKDFKNFAGMTPQNYDRMIAGTRLQEMF